jgi:hypothetical protein
MVDRLRELLGSDWSWQYNGVTDILEVHHPFGVSFYIEPRSLEEIPVEWADPFATAILDAVEDGIKGAIVFKVEQVGDSLKVEVLPPQ